MKILFALLFPIVIFSQNSFDDAQKLYAKESYNETVILLKNHLQKSPKDSKALELLGDAYGKLKAWEEAKRTYKLLATEYPKNANFHYKYGGVLGMIARENKMKALGYLDDIKTELDLAATLDPKHIDVRWALVQFYTELPGFLGGSMETSLKYADELEKISKVDGYLAKGYIYQEDGDEDEAEKFFKQALNTGGSITCYEKLADFYVEEERYGDAIHIFQSGYENLHHNYFLYKIGEIAALNKIALQKGAHSLETFIDSYSSKEKIALPWAHYRLSQVYRNLGNKKDALYQINLALNHHPQQKEFKKEKALIERL